MLLPLLTLTLIMCHLNTVSGITIDKQVQLNDFYGTKQINSSLIIIGSNITNLYPLRHLEIINGYLMIIQANNLHSLTGLENIKSINGKYSDDSSVFISGNSNLCYANTINWTLITPFTSNIYDNNDKCNCDIECTGCFGDGLCQLCNHYKMNNKMNTTSTGLCVYECPTGTITINDTKTCIEIMVPGTSTITYNFNSSSIITLKWSDPNPNGIISGHKLYINNSLVYTNQVEYPDTNSDFINQYSFDTTLNNNLTIILYSRNGFGWNNGTIVTINVKLTEKKNNNNKDEGNFISNLNIYVKIAVIAGVVLVIILVTVIAVRHCNKKAKVVPRDESSNI